jgi:CMP/dCMP kinase
MGKIITIDGPAGSGKSTVSRVLAEKLGFLYLDTGAMYRAVALHANRLNIDFKDGGALEGMCKNLNLRFVTDEISPRIFIDDEDVSLLIRKPEMDMLASNVSAVNEVRKAMTELQRNIGKTGDLVAEGRDMGTVVFPDADFKFFVTASHKARSERRYSERLDRGESVLMGDVEADLTKRDEQDTSRAIAPLKPAADAVIIDTSSLNIAQVVERMLSEMN